MKKKPNQKQLQKIKRKFILLFNNKNEAIHLFFILVVSISSLVGQTQDAAAVLLKNAPIAYLYENFLFCTSFIIIFVFVFVGDSPVGPFLIANIK